MAVTLAHLLFFINRVLGNTNDLCGTRFTRHLVFNALSEILGCTSFAMHYFKHTFMDRIPVLGVGLNWLQLRSRHRHAI